MKKVQAHEKLKLSSLSFGKVAPKRQHESLEKDKLPPNLLLVFKKNTQTTHTNTKWISAP